MAKHKRSISPKINGYSNAGRLVRKETKRAEGEERNAKWRSLTPTQQLAELDKRGITATKQRRRLTAQLGGV